MCEINFTPLLIMVVENVVYILVYCLIHNKYKIKEPESSGIKFRPYKIFQCASGESSISLNEKVFYREAKRWATFFILLNFLTFFGFLVLNVNYQSMNK